MRPLFVATSFGSYYCLKGLMVVGIAGALKAVAERKRVAEQKMAVGQKTVAAERIPVH